MLETLLAALFGALAGLLRDMLADLNRDRALREAGAAAAAATVNKETADAETRMREANARPRGDDAALERLRRGEF